MALINQKNQKIGTIQQFLLSPQPFKFCFKWCLAHKGIIANEKADVLAKIGTRQHSDNSEVLLSYLKRKIKEQQKEDWKISY